ncbi:MAG: hypothetical protein O7F56_02725 [Acidobacteria bacterium]|nr:hypothetical protein [Acidobacteriota bacterium]
MSRPNFDNSFDSFPERDRRSKGSRKSEGGYVLLVLLMFSTLLFISLGAAIPNTLRMGQRELEEELLFRGHQYMRAIDLYFRQFGRYPATVEELVKTDNMRFLRRAYKDPMTREGEWRFIHADASGTVVDSLTSPPPAAPASSGSAFGSSLSSAPGTRTRTSSRTRGSSSAGSPGGFGSSSFASQSSRRGNASEAQFIVGVASRSKQKSIRVWNEKTHYNEWEFFNQQDASGGSGQSPSPAQPEGRPGRAPSSSTPANR